MKRLMGCLGLALLGLADQGKAVDWRAYADGETDAAEALEQAIRDEGAVRLPRGIYHLSRTVEVPLAEIGWASLEGGGVARLRMSGPGPALRLTGSHGGTAAPSTVEDEVWANERFPVIRGIEILGQHPEADGIEAHQTMQLTLHQVLVRECRHAVRLVERNRNVLISDCHFYENRGIGVYLDDVNLHQINIANSHISYNGGGGVVSRAGNVRNLHIGNCDIEGNHSAEGPPTANVLLDSTGGSIGEVAITGCTIQHTRKAPDSANIRILGKGTDPAYTRRTGGETTREGNITITGNVFSDVQVNVHLREVRGVTLTGNTFWQGMEFDLLVEQSSKVLVVANNFDHNPRYAVNGTNGEERRGVRWVDSADAIFSNNLVSENRFQAAAADFENCSRMQVQGNTIIDGTGVMLRLTDCQNCLVTGNLLQPNREGGFALRVKGGDDNLVKGNLTAP